MSYYIVIDTVKYYLKVEKNPQPTKQSQYEIITLRIYIYQSNTQYHQRIKSSFAVWALM